MLLKTYIFYVFYFSFFHICICIYPFLTTLAAWFSIPSLKSWIPHIVRSWNLQQRVSLTTDTDWRWHYLGHVTHTFTYQEPILKLGKTEKWHHHSIFFVGRIYLSKFQIDSTSKSQDMTVFIFANKHWSVHSGCLEKWYHLLKCRSQERMELKFQKGSK